MPSDGSIDWSSSVTAIGTAILAVVTLVYVILTHQILRSQTDPFIIVYAQNRPSIDMRVMIEIVIENVGNGVARDVRFLLSRPLRSKLLTTDGSGNMNEGPLLEGIPALGPRQKRVLLWGHFDDVNEGLKGKPIRVTVHYKRANDALSTDIESESVLEVESLRHNELRFEDGTWECARHLQDIAEKHRNRS